MVCLSVQLIVVCFQEKRRWEGRERQTDRDRQTETDRVWYDSAHSDSAAV